MKTIAMELADKLVREGADLTPEEVTGVQNERLHELVDYVRENSPYLKELYKDLPEDYTLEDLPVTEKGPLLAHYNDWVTDPEVKEDLVRTYLARDPSDTSLLLGKYTALQTSGSTGNPLPMVRDDYHNKIHGVLLRQRLFSGMEPGFFDHSRHKMAFVVYISNSASSYGSYVKMRRRHPGYEDRIIAISIMDRIESIVEQLNEFQPEIITAYPPILVMLAEEKEKGNLNIPLKLIVSSSELLTEEAYYRIHDVFGCRILNNYCMTEGGEISMTCDCPHLHINHDWIIVEPVDADHQVIRDGETFSTGILVTDLTNYVQPIIRYYVGDSVRIRKELSDCNNRPIMDIDGRTWKSFEIGGKTISSKSLDLKSKYHKGIVLFQYLQIDDNTMEVRGVCAAGYEKSVVLPELAEIVEDYFRECGCENAVVRWSEEPMMRNARGGKTPVYMHL